ACDGGSDAAQAQYAQTLAADSRAKRKRAVVCAAPAALADIALGLTDASRRRQDQRPGKVCHAIVEHIGCIADLNVTSARGIDIQLLVADAPAADGLQARQGVDCLC